MGKTVKQIDVIDSMIIKELLIDARRNFVEIAKKCKISTDTVAEHIFELEKSGIIVGSTIQVNRKAMGRKAVCSILVKAEPNKVDEVAEYLRKISYDVPFLIKSPKSNIALIVGLNNIDEIGNLKETIRRNKYILDLKIENWLDVKSTPENLEITPQSKCGDGKEKNVTAQASHRRAGYKLDDTDLQLIEKLMCNSRQSFGEIAKEIESSISTVSRKYKKLTQPGIIRPVIQVNLSKLGYQAVDVFSLSYAPQSDSEAIIRELAEIKDNILMIKASGEYDLFVHVVLRDLNQLLETQNQIANVEGVARMESVIYPVTVPWPAVGEYISTF